MAGPQARAAAALLVTGGELYGPQPLGPGAVLAVAGRVAAVGDAQAPPGWEVERLDAQGGTVVPGLVDQHVHLAGGGGGAGPSTANPPVALSALLGAGITTAVGCVGYDRDGPGLRGLLHACRALRAHGLGAYWYCGGISFPPQTLTGEVATDIAWLPDCLGVKVGVADELSALRSVDPLRDVVAAAGLGARAAGKPPTVHVHAGRAPEGLGLLLDAAAQGAVPAASLVATHVNWSEHTLEQAAALARLGATVDVTACLRPRFFEGAVPPEEAVRRLAAAGVPTGQLTVSSDSNGSVPVRDDDGAVTGIDDHPPEVLLEALRGLVGEGGLATSDALEAFTRAPAARLGLAPVRGVLRPGARADLLVLDDGWRVRHAVLAGRVVVRDGRAQAAGFFEEQ